KQDKIFERFFQDDLPGSLVNQGSGIGLAITREFVKLNNGSILVDSEPGKGSVFTVILPVTKMIPETGIVPPIEFEAPEAEDIPELAAEPMAGEGAPVEGGGKKKTV